MPKYRLFAPGLGIVTLSADTEACARHTLAEHTGHEPEHFRAMSEAEVAEVVAGGAMPVVEGLAPELDPELAEVPCDCSDCRPDLVRLPQWAVGLAAAGFVGLASLVLGVALRRPK